MQELIRELIEAEVQRQFTLALKAKDSKNFSLEGISEDIARTVVSKLPKFTEERKRDFDDPYDSFSTELYTRWVTDWK